MVVTQAKLRQNVFTAIESLIEDNLPTYSFDSTPFTYTLVSELPNEDAVFPTVELDSARADFITITLDGATGDIEIEVTLKFYTDEEHGKKAIEVAQDSLMNTFIGNIPTFIGIDNLMPMEDFWTDNIISEIDIDNQVINTATSIIKFKLG